MPLNDLKERQKQLAEVGRIRLGHRVPANNGKVRPEKLATLRFTSAARHLIDEVARQYGGEVRNWQGASGPEFEVITDVSKVPVYVARQKIDPWYEMWGNGVMQRRCDGITESKRNTPCMCAPVRAAARASGRDLKPGEVCKPTVRASVMLADVPGFGVWRVDSHGINAATKGLGGHIADWIASLPDNARVPAWLMMVPHKEKHLIIKNGQEKIETYEFMVPQLFVDAVSARQIEGGTDAMLEAFRAADRREVTARQLAAIEASAAEVDDEKLTEADVIRVAPAKKTIEQLQELWGNAGKDGVLTEAAKAAMKARAAELDPPKPAAAEGAPTSTPAPTDVPAPPVPAGEPVDAEMEPNPDALWVQIQAAAGERKWNAEALEQRICTRFGKPSDEINGFHMATFLAEVNKGEIQ
ncbi:hypothetical protein MED01_002335 [Micromonospora sp. MED01]|uniref:recombination directionality factor n=1 Tax=Micromonospora alfalfae TaxID=2911212 RepID=UPI001EE86CAC|nr:hypothetical protein [Micromonospora alfalfae]MCG5464170.1 hypothetical protein [Micromonospora alfalfae]